MFEEVSRKRKWCWNSGNSKHGDEIGVGGQKLKPSGIGIELHVESPLPPEWQQCLDLQTGQIYYYNSATQTKTWHDPREKTAVAGSQSMQLDLQMNLPENGQTWKQQQKEEVAGRRNLSDLFDENSGEMIAVACAQCHMFVMFYKAFPSCPNCKYVHPIDLNLAFRKKNIMPPRQTLSLLDYDHDSVQDTK